VPEKELNLTLLSVRDKAEPSANNRTPAQQL
jgi:hypothetical protein